MGSDTRRLVLAFALSMAVMMLWAFLAPRPKPGSQPAQPAAAQKAAPATPSAAPGSSAPAAALAAAATPSPTEPEKTVILAGNGFKATFSTWGGALKSLTLEDEKFRRGQGSAAVQVDLVSVTAGQPYPLSLSIAPEGAQAADAAATARAPMAIEAQDEKSVTFTASVAGSQVRKTFRLTGKPFELSLAVEVSGSQGGNVALLYPTFTPPNTPTGGFLPRFLSAPSLDISQPICRAGDGNAVRYDAKAGKEAEKLVGDVSWMGGDQHYFVAAAFPSTPQGTCVLSSSAEKGAGSAALVLPMEKARKADFIVYAGPKELDTLRSYGRGFDTSLNYGTARFFAVFARGLLYVMRWLQAFVGNWGIAIILLTLLVKVVLFPLTYKQMQSMNEMRKLQPEIEKLKAKFGDDREKLNMAVMQLYQQHKVNPLGGCLPMLLQMPIWFALYAALQTSVELYRQGFLWIHDLTQRDPYFALPIAMGVSSFVMQKLSPQPTESSQAKMMLYFFPIFFTVIMLNVPAGLTLYIFVNNVLSIAQQQYMMKKQAVAVAPAKG